MNERNICAYYEADLPPQFPPLTILSISPGYKVSMPDLLLNSHHIFDPQWDNRCRQRPFFGLSNYHGRGSPTAKSHLAVLMWTLITCAPAVSIRLQQSFIFIGWKKIKNKTRNDKLLHNSVWKILPGLQAEFNFPRKWCVYLKILLKAEGFVCVHETKFLLSVIIKEKKQKTKQTAITLPQWGAQDFISGSARCQLPWCSAQNSLGQHTGPCKTNFTT